MLRLRETVWSCVSARLYEHANQRKFSRRHGVRRGMLPLYLV